MMIIRSFFLFAILLPISASAMVPTMFDAYVVSRSVPIEDGYPVELKDTWGRCSFFGNTRSEEKPGFIAKMMGQRNYFMDLSYMVCGENIITFSTTSARYEMNLVQGDKVKVPYVEILIGSAILKISDTVSSSDFICDKSVGYYFMRKKGVEYKVKLISKERFVGCRDNDHYIVGGKTFNRDGIKDLIISSER